jgi:Flp pilus assembly protein TadG
MSSRRRRDEQGQMTVLIIGFTAIILLMIVVVTDISKVFLVRRELDATADGAVLAAANGLAAIYAQPAADGNAELDPDQARRLTADYLDQVAASNKFDGLDWSADVDGTTVTVRLTSTVDLPFEPPGWPGSSDIASEAAAVVPIR